VHLSEQQSLLELQGSIPQLGVGTLVGATTGAVDGAAVGAEVGADGAEVGAEVGADGAEVGAEVGFDHTSRQFNLTPRNSSYESVLGPTVRQHDRVLSSVSLARRSCSPLLANKHTLNIHSFSLD
jgi:hypothetical protein